MTQAKIILKPRRDTSVLRRHPWIFSGGIARTEGDPQSGQLVAIYDHQDTHIAWGHYSAHSQIRVRIFSWNTEDSNVDTLEFWEQRFQRAVEGRTHLVNDDTTNAYRLIYAESDGIPGVICDLYDRVAVVQFLTAGAFRLREFYTDILWDKLDIDSLYERSDSDVMHKEGLKARTGLLRGDAVNGNITIMENGLNFEVDIRSGHKTGFYLDQRENRQRVGNWVIDATRGDMDTSLRILNVFSYTGAFSIYALAHGASEVVNVDSSASALKTAHANMALNSLPVELSTNIEGDAFKVLRELRRQGERFDAIIVDPPKFAYTQKDVKRASRGYKDINMQAMHLLKPNGALFTFSCSGAINADLFQKIMFGAALDVRRDMRITGYLAQSADHPVALTFPEAAYLKGLIVQAGA